MRRSVWVALATLAFAALLGYAALKDQESRAGSEFTPEQRHFLETTEPRGVFISRHTFRTCQEGNMAYYYADWAFTTTREQCWSHLLPVIPSFLPVK